MLREELELYIASGQAGIRINTREIDEVRRTITALQKGKDWVVRSWDAVSGLACAPDDQFPTGFPDTEEARKRAKSAINVLGAFCELPVLFEGRPKTDTYREFDCILVVRNFHRIATATNQEMFSAIVQDTIRIGAARRHFLIAIMPPEASLPPELDSLFSVIDHELPSAGDLEGIVHGIDGGPDQPNVPAACTVALGLNRLQAERVFAASLVRDGTLDLTYIRQEKVKTINRSKLLTLYQGGETFLDIGGLDRLKEYCVRLLAPDPDCPVKPRGVLLYGLGGTGKSLFAKALGLETDRATLQLDVGTLMSRDMGGTEAQTREAFSIVDAMSPSILFIDEIGSALAGVDTGGRSDGGVMDRFFMSFLRWMQDRKSDSFVVGTTNKLDALPDQFIRRFNKVYFYDLPGFEQRQKIWAIHLTALGLDANQPHPADADWTGDDIRRCCEEARKMRISLVEAAVDIVPSTSSETLERLRQDAENRRCMSTEYAGRYQRKTELGIEMPEHLDAPSAEEAPARRRTKKL